jgi:hypothetical protein
MNEYEVYAMEMMHALETAYRTPAFTHRVALLTGLRNLLGK